MSTSMHLIVVIALIAVLFAAWVFMHVRQPDSPADSEDPQSTAIDLSQFEVAEYAIPTICDRLPPLQEDTHLSLNGAVLIHEDDWRQIEFVCAEDRNAVNDQLEALSRFKQEKCGRGGGWTEVFVRSEHPTPLHSRRLTRRAVLDGMRAGTPQPLLVHHLDGPRPVLGGFAVTLGEGVVLYGHEENGVLMTCGLAFSGEDHDSIPMERLADFMADSRLLLVNWYLASWIDLPPGG